MCSNETQLHNTTADRKQWILPIIPSVQLLVSTDSTNATPAIDRLAHCSTAVRLWFLQNGLQLNTDKSEVVLLISAPLLSSGQLPTSPPSTLPEALCRSHRSSSRLAWWPLIPTCSSTVTRETMQMPATSTLAHCATCAVYWLTTSPRQSRAASSLPGWTTAMHCWVAHRRRLSTSYSAPRTTWPE